MDIESTLKTVVKHLRSGHLNNEAQVKQSAILPILRALGWDDTDPEAFKPEYSVGRGLVDYALLHLGKPQIFIEAKRIGAMDAGGEEQLFGYASNKGVPLLILTDGDRWDFYLSMAAGIPTERRFYRLELQLEHKIQEYTEFLEKHFQKDRVVSGEARRNAEQRHASNLERHRAHEAIPDAWQTLLMEPDEILRDLLAEKVESECGTKPELDDIEEFLQNLPTPSSKEKSIAGSLVTPSKPNKPNKSRLKSVQFKKGRIVGFVFGGKEFDTRTSKGTLVQILTMFGHQDPGFMERFAAKTVGKTRSLVAKNRTDLYKKPHLLEYSAQLENGWWLGTNLSTSQIRKYIEIACDVAGVGFGSQLNLRYQA